MMLRITTIMIMMIEMLPPRLLLVLTDVGGIPSVLVHAIVGVSEN